MKTKRLIVLALHLGLAATVVAQPVITNQPQSQTNVVGATVIFSVGATGAPPLSYQWAFRTLNNRLPGATNDTLVLSNVQASNAGNYRVTITNDAGSVLSGSAVLTVVTPPVITPANPTASLFADVTLLATNVFAGAISYQWLLNGEPIDGAVTNRLVVTNVQKTNAGNYALVVTYAFGSATSQVAKLKIVPFSSIYCFGDCLTDTHTYTPGFPNWNGRFSNGPMWVDVASSNLILTYVAANNFAAAGYATFDVLNRINLFRAPRDASTALFTIWAGPVDFYYHLGSDSFFGPFIPLTNEVAWNQAVVAGVSNLSNAVVRLYSMGGRSFLVPTIDDVSRQPVVIRTHTEETRRGIQAKVDQFNDALVRALGALDQSLPDLRIVIPDAGGLITRFIEHPQDYGMTVAFPAAAQDPALFDKSLTGPGADYVWWDEYGHPTTKGHGALADLFLAALRDARPESLNVSVAGAQVNIQMKKLLRGRDYTLQTSSDLASWHDVQTFTAAAGTNQVLHTVEAGTRSTFYHLQWQP